MAEDEHPNLSDESGPRQIGDDLVRKFTTVSMDSITVDITSTKHIRRTITYDSIRRFPSKFDKNDRKQIHHCGNNPLKITIGENDLGSVYHFLVVASAIATNRIVECYQFSLKAEMNKAEMHAFLSNILERVDPWSMTPAYFYRNFTKKDEERILADNGGFFEMTMKQKSGNRSSPLYKRLHNITYLSCKLFVNDYNGQLSYLPDGYKFPPSSPFGEERIAFRASTILNEESVLFLGGMHCYASSGPTRPHYISVVICQRGSLSYHECVEMGLIELPLDNNPILQWDKSTDSLSCANELMYEGDEQLPHSVWPEIILCDQPVALADGERSTCAHTLYRCLHRSSVDCESCHGYRTRIGGGGQARRRRRTMAKSIRVDKENSSGYGDDDEDENSYGGSFINDSEEDFEEEEEEATDQVESQESRIDQASRDSSPDIVIDRTKKNKRTKLQKKKNNVQNVEKEEEDEEIEDDEEEEEDEDYVPGMQEDAAETDLEETQEDLDETDEEEAQEDGEESSQLTSTSDDIRPRKRRISSSSSDEDSESARNHRSSNNGRKRGHIADEDDDDDDDDCIANRTRRKTK